MCGPCIVLGQYVRETRGFFMFRGRDGKTYRVKKKGDLVHVEPCKSCRDHELSFYGETE